MAHIDRPAARSAGQDAEAHRRCDAVLRGSEGRVGRAQMARRARAGGDHDLGRIPWRNPTMNGVVITRGLRNHNPGNLKWFASIPWRGQTGHDADGYATFSADFYGLRAMAKNIIAAVVNHHCLNLDALIPRYAPSAD